jgi:Fe-Mn family superoxide dismutase
MRYKIAPLFCRPWTLNGISPRLIESHYENDYGNALSSLNAITAELEALDPATTAAAVIHRLKRDEAALLNSTLLHELYFASLGGDGRTLPEPMAQAIARDFGSVKRWRDEFIALAYGLAGSSGWVLLTYVPRDARLINHTAAGHEQSLAGGIPILALDMYEHAYHLEFRREAGCLRRRLHAEHRMGHRAGTVSKRRERGAAAATRTETVCQPSVDHRRGGQRHARVREAGADHRHAPPALQHQSA